MAGKSGPWGEGSRRSFALTLCATGVALLFLFAPPAAAETTKADADALLAKGRALIRQQDFAGARAPLEQALTAYQTLGLSREQADTLLPLGAVCTSLSQSDRARGCFTQALGIYRKLGMQEKVREVVFRLGDLELSLSRYEQARGWYEQGLAVSRGSGLERDQADVLFRLGRVASALSRYEQAQSYYDQALDIYRRKGLERESMRMLISLGELSIASAEARGTLSQCDQASRYFEEALSISRKLGMDQPAAYAVAGQARAADALSQYGRAERLYQQALSAFRKLKLQREEALALSDLGRVARLLGNYGEALDCDEQARAAYRGLGDEEGQAGAALDLGEIAGALGDYDRALAYHREALTTYRRLGLQKEAADALRHLGSVTADAGRYAEVVDCYKQALAIFHGVGPDAGTGATEALMADELMSQGRLKEAEEALVRARVGPQLRGGRLLLLRGNPREAAKRFESVLGRAGERLSFQVAGAIGLGQAREALGEWHRAADAYRRAVDLIDQAREGTPSAERGRFFEAKDLGFRRLDAYEGLVRVLHRLGKDAEAFYWSEHIKARALVEALARAPFGAPLGLPADLRQREDELSDQIATLSRQLDEGIGQRLAIEQELRSLRAAHETLVSQLRREHPEYASVRYPRPLHANELKLGAHQVLIAYEVTDRETFVFLVRGGKVARAFEVKLTRPELEGLVLAYRAGFAEARRTADLRALQVAPGQRLYRLLLAPVLAQVKPGEQALVVPDEAIGLLPLEALVESVDQVLWQEGVHGGYPAGVHFVGEQHTFSYWQSATAMATVRSLRARAGEARVLLVADPVFETSDSRLQATQLASAEPGGAGLELRGALAESLKATYGEGVFQRIGGAEQLLARLCSLYGENLTALVGLEASKGRLRQEPLERYGEMIFATHGVLGSNVPWLRQPALVLSQVDNPPGENGYLTMAEVMDLKLRADVVGLMACETAAGKVVGGEGVMAMGRAFQYAGARSVLASLWKAEDASTNLLTEVFLEQLAAGQDKAQALQAARQRVREAGYVHPFYWASFVLIGERGVAGREQGQAPAETRD